MAAVQPARRRAESLTRRQVIRRVRSHPGLIARAARAVFALLVLTLASALEGRAQGTPDSLSRRDSAAVRARVRSDSAARVRAVADSILLEDDPDDELVLDAPPAIRQSITMQSLNRGYTIGSNDISENVGLFTYRWSGPDWKLLVSGSPLRYSGNGTTITGLPPVTGRVDWTFAKGDTLRVYGRSGSVPATLDSMQVAAIGAVSVSTLDLESFTLGTSAMLGTRAVFTFDVGDVQLGLHGGLEYQPRPSGTSRVYWTGTTLLGGASLSGLASDVRWTGALDVSHSSADSLPIAGDSVGRNLFQGGGSFNASFQFDGPLTAAGDATGVIGAWYQRPFGNDRPDQPNRLLPVGDTYGAFLSLDLPIGSLTLSPSVSVARESASDDARVTRLLKYQYDAASWAVNTGAGLTIPLGKHFDLTPEFGATFGGASARFTASTAPVPGRRPGRSTTTDLSAGIRGWWAGLELTISF